MSGGTPSVAARLEAAGLALPGASEALGLYRPAVRTGDLVFTAGQLPTEGGALMTSGHVGATVSEPVARKAAQVAALNALAAASSVCDLDEVTGVVRLTGYVSSAPGFSRQPAVMDGASEVMAAAFGDAGAHSRVAVGVSILPLDAPVEVDVVLRLGA